VSDAEQARKLLDNIDFSTVVGLRDRALIGVMTFAFGCWSCAAKQLSTRSSGRNSDRLAGGTIRLPPRADLGRYAR
jgi:hypothetical protein